MTEWTCPFCCRGAVLVEHTCPQMNALLEAFQVRSGPPPLPAEEGLTLARLRLLPPSSAITQEEQ